MWALTNLGLFSSWLPTVLISLQRHSMSSVLGASICRQHPVTLNPKTLVVRTLKVASRKNAA